MSHLNTKLWRELRRSRWQFAAVAVTVMLGIAFFQAFLISYHSLGRSYDHTYDLLAFGDVWVRMEAAPSALPRRLEALPGVDRAIGRIVEEVRVSLRGRPVGQVAGRLISVPTERQPEINQVRVVEGSYLSPAGGRQALLELGFAEAHGFRPGDFIYPTVRGEEVRFRVVGIVQSPEYIYAIRSEQSMLPTPDIFGVIFIPHRQAEALLNMQGRINEVCLATTSPEVRDAVASQVAGFTDRYGGEDPMTRDDQPSHRLLAWALDMYRIIAIVLPVLFLMGTGFTSYTTLARMVQAQTPQIGVLRAMGFSRRVVLRHFLLLSVIPSICGGLLGIGLGYSLAWLILRLYLTLIHLPHMFFEWRPEVAVAALVIAICSGLVGAAAPARRAAALPPAQAMSQQAMLTTHVSPLMRWVGAGLPFVLKLPMRDLVRQPKRALYTLVGLVLGVCFITFSLGTHDSVEHSVVTHLEEMERYDLAVGFVPEQPGRIVRRISSLPGVTAAEPSLDIPIEIEHGGVRETTVLSGLLPGARLRRLTDEEGRPVVPEPGAVLLGAYLRSELGVGEGDLVTLHYLRNRPEFRIVRTARVGPPISQVVGHSAFMRMDDVQHLFAHRLGYPHNAATAALIGAEPGAIGAVRARLDRIPAVASVQSHQDLRDHLDEFLEMRRAMFRLLALFGVALAAAVVFTSVSINVLERVRELATLRTLGYPFRSVVFSVTVENLILMAFGLALGMPLGGWLSALLIRAVQVEAASFEPIILTQTYVTTVLLTLAITLLSPLQSFRHLGRLNLAAAVKEIGG